MQWSIYFCSFFILETYIQSTNFGANLHNYNKVIGEKMSNVLQQNDYATNIIV